MSRQCERPKLRMLNRSEGTGTDGANESDVFHVGLTAVIRMFRGDCLGSLKTATLDEMGIILTMTL
jgi:hypothetical protein